MVYRISRQLCFMQVAEVVAQRSTCFRRNVGAVITVDNHIVSIGWNGSPKGQPHCIGAGCADPRFGCTRAVHAELNALKYLPDTVRGTKWHMYVTESPCPSCAREIMGTPISAVFFLHPYRLSEGRDMLMASGTRLYRVTPAGHIIDCATEELIELD